MWERNQERELRVQFRMATQEDPEHNRKPLPMDTVNLQLQIIFL